MGNELDHRVRLSARAEHGHVIATLCGDLDIAAAPALREQLLSLLRPGTSRLVVDLSAVSYADASGLAVLVGTRRRARLLGGFLHLASPAPAVTTALALTGLRRQLDVFPTVHAAITSPPSHAHRQDKTPGTKPAPGPAEPGPAAAHTARTWRSPDGGELRLAIAAVLTHADAWRDADPGRHFTTSLQTLAQAHAGASHAAMTHAAQALLSTLARRPLTHSPAVAATASQLRRLLDPDPPPPPPGAPHRHPKRRRPQRTTNTAPKRRRPARHRARQQRARRQAAAVK
jgi:anti-sigma B factor antagonist